jgi:hypothetical protein
MRYRIGRPAQSKEFSKGIIEKIIVFKKEEWREIGGNHNGQNCLPPASGVDLGKSNGPPPSNSGTEH